MLPQGHLAAGMTVLERQQAHIRWQGQNGNFSHLEVPNQLVSLDPGTGNGWPELGRFDIPSSGIGNPKLSGRQGSLKKRKFESMHSAKVCAAARYLSI